MRVFYSGFFDPRTSYLMRLPYTVVNSSDLRRVFVEKKGCMHDKWERLDILIESILEDGKAAGEFDQKIPTPIIRRAFLNFLFPPGFERLNINYRIFSD